MHSSNGAELVEKIESQGEKNMLAVLMCEGTGLQAMYSPWSRYIRYAVTTKRHYVPLPPPHGAEVPA